MEFDFNRVVNVAYFVVVTIKSICHQIIINIVRHKLRLLHSADCVVRNMTSSMVLYFLVLRFQHPEHVTL